ncbi:hypothetical protein MGN70_008220 [Eutypa lata]|nr:hypothetical protein MGN70_008220 [Eutypa lata]
MKSTHTQTYLLLSLAASLATAQVTFTSSGTVYVIDGATAYTPIPYTVDGVTYTPGPGALHPTLTAVAGAVRARADLETEAENPEAIDPFGDNDETTTATDTATGTDATDASATDAAATDAAPTDATATDAAATDATATDATATDSTATDTATGTSSETEAAGTSSTAEATGTKPLVEVTTTSEGAAATATLSGTSVGKNDAGRLVVVDGFVFAGLVALVEGMAFYML